jgi:two-component system, NtrC family, response regulator
MADVLIIDDDQGFCYVLTTAIQSLEHKTTCCHTLREGLRAASSSSFDVVFLDVMLPDGNGLDILPKIRETASRPEVIIMTSRGDPDGAELAIRSGAWDYVQKPSSIKAITLPLVRALQYREEKNKPRSPLALKREGIIGSSSQIKACLDLLARASISEANILIAGETGTGKELFASAIHQNSRRSAMKFVIVDCATLPETLVESILFGHEKGAFTGAEKAQEGLIRQADGGTLFLDEVGELPPSIQKAFLRTLQERRFRPLGGQQEVTSDFRLVAATNRNLDEMADEGRFRKDLLYRLQSFRIDLPSLQERPEDIRELAMFQINRLSRHYGTGIKGISPEFLEAIATYQWPGNVRELLNAMERAIVSAGEEPTLFPNHLPINLRVKLTRDAVRREVPVKEPTRDNAIASRPFPTIKEFRESLLAEGEIRYLNDLLAHSGGDIEKACSLSGLAQARVYGLLKKYRISRNRY